MKVIFLLLLLSVYFCKAKFPRCSDCPLDTKPCNQVISLKRDDCACNFCISRCNIRFNWCPGGKQCIEEPMKLYNKMREAKCVPFTECPQQQCKTQCPVSGYFVDKNGCSTCICEDPCAELQCPDNCVTFSTSTFMEAEYVCDEDL